MIDVEKWLVLVREARRLGRPMIEVPTPDLEHLLGLKLKADDLVEQCQMAIRQTAALPEAADIDYAAVRADKVVEWLT
jgi:hypothetical protein